MLEPLATTKEEPRPVMCADALLRGVVLALLSIEALCKLTCDTAAAAASDRRAAAATPPVLRGDSGLLSCVK